MILLPLFVAVLSEADDPSAPRQQALRFRFSLGPENLRFLFLDAAARSFRERMDAVEANTPYSILEEWAELWTLHYLGMGHDRAVFLSSDRAWVVKFPLERRGTSANETEAAIWRDAPDVLRRWLVPVLAADMTGEWLVMEAVETDAPRPFSEEALAVFQSFGVEDLRWMDNAANDGRLLDYGEVWR